MNAPFATPDPAAREAAFAQLTAWAGWALYAFTALNVVLGVDTLVSSFAVAQLSWATEGGDVVAMAQQIDTLLNTEWQSVLGLTSLLVNSICVVLILRWLFVAKQRAIKLGAPDARYSPWATVLWYLVPLAQLFMPYLTVRELWCTSAAASPHWHTEKLPRTLPVWWTCWIASNLAAAISWFLMLPLQQIALAQMGAIDLVDVRRSLTVAQLQGDSQLALLLLGLGQFIAVGASLALLWLVQKVAKMQRNRRPVVLA